MTPEAQRIAIAEACGFVAPFATHNEGWSDEGGGGVRAVLHDFTLREVPDYLGDLNAMHEAEPSEVVGLDLTKWVTTLSRVVLKGLIIEQYEVGLLVRATAAQRAEAFLRTLGKWEESA